MYTSKPIKLHNKCLIILEMIQKINNRIEIQRVRLLDYDNAKAWDMICLMYRRTVLVNDLAQSKKIKERLVKYYEDTFNKLIPYKKDVISYPTLERYGDGENEYLRPLTQTIKHEQ